MTVIELDFLGNPEIPKNGDRPPPPKQPKMTLSGGWRGRGAHDIEGTSARAREKRETKRATRARVEQREVRGAFCSAFLARARADSVGGGAPACTSQPRLASIWAVPLLFGPTKLDKLWIQKRHGRCFRDCRTRDRTGELPGSKNFLHIHFAQSLQEHPRFTY